MNVDLGVVVFKQTELELLGCKFRSCLLRWHACMDRGSGDFGGLGDRKEGISSCNKGWGNYTVRCTT